MNKVIIILAVVAAIGLALTLQGDSEINTGDRAASADEKAVMEKAYASYEMDGVFNYGFIYYSADLNDDGTDEMLRSYLQGSGIISCCVECIEGTTETFTQLCDRSKMDYTLYIYKDTLYIITSQSYLSSYYDTPHAYRPGLEDNKLVLEDIDKDLEEEILEIYEKEQGLPLGISKSE